MIAEGAVSREQRPGGTDVSRGRLARTALLCSFLATPAAGAQTSALWGVHGELWNPASRLPDFSFAGYRAGDQPLPVVAVVVNVLDFGAKGDGSADDAPAIQAAIDAASTGAVLLPKGRYRIGTVLSVDKSGVVLRGEGSGMDGSVLVIDKSLSDVFGPDPKWSYSGGFVHFHSAQIGVKLAALASPAARGSRGITLASAAALSPGQLIELRQVDGGDGSLGRHLHAELADSGTCAYQLPLRFDWPVRVESSTGAEVTLRQPLRTDVRAEWSPELWTLPALAEVGAEHLRIEFPDVPYAGHLKEPGYNALFFSDGVVDSWLRDVTVVNADDAFLTESRVKNLSVVGVRTLGRPGHHGFNLNQSADVLIDGFEMASEWWHTVTIDHRTNGTVVTRGTSALPMSLDHHRDSPFENLFTELSAYGFQSGGSTCAGPQAGARNTYWNLAPPMSAPLLWTVMQSNIIGNLSPDLTPSQTPEREWIESLPEPDPPNLYDAQLAARHCGTASNPCARYVWAPSDGSCEESPRPEGAACDDGDPSTTGDICSKNTCRGTAADDDAEASGCGCKLQARAPAHGSGLALMAFSWALLAGRARRGRTAAVLERASRRSHRARARALRRRRSW